MSNLIAAEPLFPENLLLDPTEDDLPCDDGVPMETQRHKMQMDLLVDSLAEWLADRDAYVGGNMFVYFNLEQAEKLDIRGPDVFVALDVTRRERKSWVSWREGKGPDVVIELLSDSTAKHDKTAKKTFYQDVGRVPEYFWYDPFDPEDFAGFSLHGGRYKALRVDKRGRLKSERVGLFLARWTGTFKGVPATWLRWMTPEGEWLPTAEELAARARTRADAEAERADAEAHRADAEAQRAEAEAQRAEAEAKRAEAEAQRAEAEAKRAEVEAKRAEAEASRAERLAARLRELGEDPDRL